MAPRGRKKVSFTVLHRGLYLSVEVMWVFSSGFGFGRVGDAIELILRFLVCFFFVFFDFSFVQLILSEKQKQKSVWVVFFSSMISLFSRGLNWYFSQMVGLRREDAARDAMIDYGFAERIINETIKELVQVCSSVLGSRFLLLWKRFFLGSDALPTLDFSCMVTTGGSLSKMVDTMRFLLDALKSKKNKQDKWPRNKNKKKKKKNWSSMILYHKSRSRSSMLRLIFYRPLARRSWTHHQQLCN